MVDYLDPDIRGGFNGIAMDAGDNGESLPPPPPSLSSGAQSDGESSPVTVSTSSGEGLACGYCGCESKDGDFSIKGQSSDQEEQVSKKCKVGFVSVVEGKGDSDEKDGFGKTLKSGQESSLDTLEEKNLLEKETGISRNQESGLPDEEVSGKGTETEELGVECSLEVKKKKLLEDLETILMPEDKKKPDQLNVAEGKASSACEDLHKMVKKVLPAEHSFGIEVIDETALIESIPAPRIGNGCRKEMGFVASAKCEGRNGMEEIDVKKSKQSRRTKKSKKVLEMGGREKEVTATDGGHCNGLGKNGDGNKKVYSRREMEALRLYDKEEQKKTWKAVYNGLGIEVAKEYDDLAGSKHQKHVGYNLDPRHCIAKKERVPAFLGAVGSESMGNELEKLDYGENFSHLDSASSYGHAGKDGLEEDFCDYSDSDEDYPSIQKPAFIVDGEPNFDSGPPEDGLEYLRRVRWEAARIPKVKVAILDRSKLDKEQSAYMPKIPEIAKCPEHLMPSRNWEDAFLADFSELRAALSDLEGYYALSSEDLQLKSMIPESCQPQKMVRKENQPKEQHESSINQSSELTEDGTQVLSESSSSRTFIDESHSNYPALSAILGMDSVARVSMLQKRISLLEPVNSLSRVDCLWLFALCAAVDTPLHADTCAALRSLLRKCATLRAGKTEMDDEVVMLNMLATISGRYFGQSEN